MTETKPDNKSASQFIVVYDDESGLCIPMSQDSDCAGAICATGNAPVVFSSRENARTAIRISRAFALLQKEQGLPHNDDFVECIRHVKVRKLVPWVAP